MLESLPLVFAQNAPAGGAPATPGGGYLQFLPIFAVVVLWWYVLLIRPQQMREKKLREMIQALKKNDKVLTASGIYGTVVSVDEKDDRVLVRIDDDRGVRVAFTRASIVRIIDVVSDKSREKATESA